MAASPGRCAKENMPKLPTLPFTLSNTSTLICAHTLLPPFHLFSNGTSLPSPLFLPPPFFTLQSALTLVFLLSFFPSPPGSTARSLQASSFRNQPQRRSVSPPSTWKREKKKPLPYFVTILYSGEKYSVGLRVNFNRRDTPQLLNAALFFFLHQPGSFVLEWLTTYSHQLHVCTLYVSGRLQEFPISWSFHRFFCSP